MSAPHPPVPADLVWYAAYGSNLSRERFLVYLTGGRIAGGDRDYPGATDATPPRADVALDLPGRLYFGGLSRVWGGGLAVYDPTSPGPTAARAWLITREQFVDIAAQEMHRAPDAADPLHSTLRAGFDGDRHTAGSGRYETVLRLGERDGVPVYTITAGSVEDLPPRLPAEAYRARIAAGLREARGWDEARIAGYLDDMAAGRQDLRSP